MILAKCDECGADISDVRRIGIWFEDHNGKRIHNVSRTEFCKVCAEKIIENANVKKVHFVLFLNDRKTVEN